MTSLHLAPESGLSVNDVPVANASMEAAIDEVMGAASRSRRLSVYFANADCVNIAARHAEYLETLKQPAVRVFADGVGMKIASWIKGQPIVDNVNGTDMFPRLCERAANAGQKVFLLGAADGVAARAAERMKRRYPGLQVVGTHHGFFDHVNCPEVIRAVNEAQPDILLVALGAPLQELFIRRHRSALQASVCMAVGGLFDFYSGDKQRAPKLVRRLGLEWAWRMGLEPARLWRRYLLGNPLFLLRVIRREIADRVRDFASAPAVAEPSAGPASVPAAAARVGREAA